MGPVKVRSYHAVPKCPTLCYSAYQELGKFIASFAQEGGDDEDEEENKDFNSAAFWKSDLPDLNFDDLLHEHDEDSAPEDDIASNSR